MQRSISLAKTLAIAVALATTVLAALPTSPVSAHNCPPGAATVPGDSSITCVYSGFMTGGGKFNSDINNAPPPAPLMPLVVHGFVLHCNASNAPNNLEINWKDPNTGAERRFHLENLFAAHCEYDPAVGSPNPPTANFNTWVGNGSGRLDGQDGAFIYAQFTDQGQPAGTQAGGPGDASTIVIYSPDGSLVLNLTDTLFGGAQQAHMCGGNCSSTMTTTSTASSSSSSTTTTTSTTTITTTTTTTITSSTTGQFTGAITVFAHRIAATYWEPCFATTCTNPLAPCNTTCTGPGVTMYFVLYDSSGNIVQTGFTDENGHTFTGLNPGITYHVYPTDCNACHGANHNVVFQYWGDGTTVRPLATNVGSSLDAWYSCTNNCA